MGKKRHDQGKGCTIFLAIDPCSSPPQIRRDYVKTVGLDSDDYLPEDAVSTKVFTSSGDRISCRGSHSRLLG